MGIDGIRFFYLSKEHYHQWFYVEPLLIVHQQWFIGKTVVDRELSTTVPRRTVVDTWPSKLGTRLPLSWQNFVSLACYRRRTVKEGTGAHAAAAGTPSPSPCRDPFTTAVAPMLGPLRHNRRGPFIVAAVGAPLTSPRRAASPPPCGWTLTPARTSPTPQFSAAVPTSAPSLAPAWPAPREAACPNASSLHLTSPPYWSVIFLHLEHDRNMTLVESEVRQFWWMLLANKDSPAPLYWNTYFQSIALWNTSDATFFL
jgi:hypothetical protein